MWQKLEILWRLNWRWSLSTATWSYIAPRLLEKRVSWDPQNPHNFLYLLGDTQKDEPGGTQPLPSFVLEPEPFIVLYVSQPHSFPAPHEERSHWSQLYHLRKTFLAFKKNDLKFQLVVSFYGWLTKAKDWKGTWEAENGNADGFLTLLVLTSIYFT